MVRYIYVLALVQLTSGDEPSFTLFLNDMMTVMMMTMMMMMMMEMMILMMVIVMMMMTMMMVMMTSLASQSRIDSHVYHNLFNTMIFLIEMT